MSPQAPKTLDPRLSQTLDRLLPGILVTAEDVTEWTSFEDYMSIWQAHGFEWLPETPLPDHQFRAVSTCQELKSVSMTAIDCSPVAINFLDTRPLGTAFLLLPIEANCTYQTHAGEVNGGHPDWAIYGRMAEMKKGREEGTYLELTLAEDRLTNTLATLLGGQTERALALTRRSALLPIRQQGTDYLQLTRHLWRLLHELKATAGLAENLGLDDSVYRMVATMLLHGQPVEAGERPLKPSQLKRLSRVCDWIMAHLHQPIRLTHLEQVSGLSARALQLLFLSHYQTSPMGWVRQQRLALAQRHLHAAQYGSLEQLAHDCGFASKSLFFTQYKALYGCTPGETLRKMRKSRVFS